MKNFGNLPSHQKIQPQSSEEKRSSLYQRIQRGLEHAQNLSFWVMILHFSKKAGEFLRDLPKSLGGLPIEFVPLPIAYEEAFLHAIKIPDLFLIALDTEKTFLVFLREGKIANLVSFSVGSEQFFSNLKEADSFSRERGESLGRQHRAGLVTAKTKNKIEESFKAALEIWEKAFLEKLDAFYSIGPIPSDVFLFGRGANITPIVNFLRDPAWFKNVSYASVPQLHLIGGENFFEGDTLGGFIRGPEDVALASLIFYSLHNESIF